MSIPTDFPSIATGSIVRLTAAGSRSTDGEPVQIPAIVLSQYPEDGQLRLFCFHFEGQFLSVVAADSVEVVFDADGAHSAQIDALRSEMAAFQESILGMLMAQSPQPEQSSEPSSASAPATHGPSGPAEPPLMASQVEIQSIIDTHKQARKPFGGRRGVAGA